MRGLLIKQHRLSDPGLIGASAAELDVELLPHVASEEALPPLQGFDFVIAMGAPWSVYGPEVEPWIEGELRLLREAVDRDVPVLGICFGAQAFAHALGGEVRKASRAEVGWSEVQTDAPELVPRGPWFMWHSDEITLPPGATLLARTEVCPQAFTLGPHLLLQFHPEVSAELLQSWMTQDVSDFEEAGRDPKDVLKETKRRQPQAQRRARALLARFLGGVPAGP